MKKTALKVLSVIMTVAILITGSSFASFAVDDSTQVRNDLAQTLRDFMAFLQTFEIKDFLGLVNAILKGLGFTSEFTGFQDFSVLADEFFAMLGGTGAIYETIINAMNANQLFMFIKALLSGK